MCLRGLTWSQDRRHCKQVRWSLKRTKSYKTYMDFATIFLSLLLFWFAFTLFINENNEVSIFEKLWRLMVISLKIDIFKGITSYIDCVYRCRGWVAWWSSIWKMRLQWLIRNVIIKFQFPYMWAILFSFPQTDCLSGSYHLKFHYFMNCSQSFRKLLLILK